MVHDRRGRGVARGEGGVGARDPTEFGRSVNPIQTKGADYARHTTTSPRPGFKMLSTPLLNISVKVLAPQLSEYRAA